MVQELLTSYPHVLLLRVPSPSLLPESPKGILVTSTGHVLSPGRGQTTAIAPLTARGRLRTARERAVTGPAAHAKPAGCAQERGQRPTRPGLLGMACGVPDGPAGQKSHALTIMEPLAQSAR